MGGKARDFIIREVVVLACVIISFFLAVLAVAFGIKYTDAKLTDHELIVLKRLILWAFGALYGGYLGFRVFRSFKKR